MVRRILPLLSAATLVSLCSAATIPVRVVGTTQTQAVLVYNAPDTNACTIVVLDSSSNLVNDTNSLLFAGADSDLRSGNIAIGTSRITVVGRRTSELAADGKLYSRALQADSPYTFQVSCSAGSARGSGIFRTRTIPLGNAGPDPFPFNDKGYGNYAYPTVDYSDPSKTYVDPQTGILLKRLTTPGYGSPGVFTSFAPFVAYDLSGNWQNVPNVLAQDGQYASYSGPGGPSNSIFIPTPTYQGQRAYIPYSENYIDDMMARLNGFGDQQNGVDRSMNVCLSADGGQSCLGNTLTFELPRSTASEISGPGNFPAPVFGGWGAPSIQADWFTADFAGNNPSVSANRSVVTNTTPLLIGAFQFAFPSNLNSGMHIRIAGSAPTCPGNNCTIVSGSDATHLTIQQDLGSSFKGAATTLAAAVSGGATSILVADASGFIPNFVMRPIYFLNIESDSVQCTGLSGNAFSGCSGLTNGHGNGAAVTSSSFALANFGFKIWKQTSLGTIRLDSVKYDYATSADYFLGYEGEGFVCAGDVTASYAADGVTSLTKPLRGKTCTITDIWGHQFLYFFDPSSGELRTIARLSDGGAFQDSSNPLLFYQYNGSSANISTCTYDAANGKFRNLPADYNDQTNPYFNCGSNLTVGSGNDVISQIKAKYPQIDMNYWGTPQFGSVVGGIATFALRPIQNAMAWVCYFDLSKPAGQQLVYCGDTWSHYPLRWGGMHGGFSSRTPNGWMTYALMSSLESSNQKATGQYTMQVSSIYNNGGATSLSISFTDTSSCEALGVTDSRWIAQGATGRNCVKLKVATEPVNTNPPLVDLAGGIPAGSRPMVWPHNAISCGGDGSTLNCWSYLQPLAEGDWLRDLADPNGDLGAERFLVAKKTILADGTIDLVLSRAASASPVPLCIGSKVSHQSGFKLMVDLPFGCNGNEFWTKADDAGHTIYPDNPIPYGAHTNLQYDTSTSSFVQWTPYSYSLGGSAPGQFGFGYGVRSGTVPNFFSKQFDYGLQMVYSFSGSLVGQDSIQTHPGSLFSYDAAGNRSIFGLDGRPLGGAGGGDPLVWNHTLTPVPGTQQVYKITLPLLGPSGQSLPSTGLDRKRRAMIGWYAHTLLKDISGPGSLITDATPDSFCIADFAGECVPGSQKGAEYVSVANADTSGQCLLSYVRKTPCLAALPNQVARYVQYDVSKPDPTGSRWRTLTSFWGGPGRTDNYANVHGGDGADWVFGVGKWADGVRSQIYGAKLPSWQLDSQYRGDFIMVPVKVGGRTGDKVRVRFGYDTSLTCTTRQEACSTGATNGDPFAWLSENVNWQSCDTGCTVTIPAIGGRVLYYAIDRKDPTGTVSVGGMQAVAVN